MRRKDLSKFQSFDEDLRKALFQYLYCELVCAVRRERYQVSIRLLILPRVAILETFYGVVELLHLTLRLGACEMCYEQTKQNYEMTKLG